MSLSRPNQRIIKTLLAIAMCAGHANGQARPDTLYLDELQHAAEAADKRGAQTALIAAQSARRVETIRNERLPALTTVGSAQYVSDVVGIGAILPGSAIAAPPHDQYDAYLIVRQPLLDPTRASRVTAERASEAELAARIRTATWQQRSAVTDAFFTARLRERQIATLTAAMDELAARLATARTRVAGGAALPSEAFLIEVELRRRQQARDEVAVDLAAARELIGAITARPVPAGAVLATRLDATDASVPVADSVRSRPEFAQFDRARDAIHARRAATAAQDRPRIAAFGRTGYGRPGLNALNRSFDAYWLAGVQVEWSPWNWGRTRRELEVQQLQADMLRSDEAAFRDALTRTTIAQRAQVTSLRQSVAADDSIIDLRARILREARLRFDEGEVGSADYVARFTDHLTAQLDRDTRRVRLDEARARYLTTLGLEVR